ncbi:MAG TPA: permease prefix domain 1-containing protein [Chthonomonadaceae bacterium]|nr:permease prefix domain 1-containing protein [Chthonomonadaceae bacterium]
MSKRVETPLCAPDDPIAPDACDRIEDYLDYLCAPLLGVVPYAERRCLRDEARQHLQDLVEEFREQGLSPQEALTRALHAHGNPWRIGQSFVQEWSLGRAAAPRNAVRRATLCAFAWFGIATVLSLLLIEQYTYEVSSQLVITRGYLMPYSYQDALFPYLIGLLLLSPIVAGCLSGLMAPRQVIQGIINALGILCANTLLTACLLLPKIEGMVFLLIQIAVWLPIGCGAAVLTATLHRYHQCQRFWQLAR